MIPNGIGFQRGRVNKREDLRKDFIHVEFNIYGMKYQLCLIQEVELGKQVRKTPQQRRRGRLSSGSDKECKSNDEEAQKYLRSIS